MLAVFASRRFPFARSSAFVRRIASIARLRAPFVCGAALFALAACSNGTPPVILSGGALSSRAERHWRVVERAPQSKDAGPVKHIVLLIQENRSFDNFFATYPGADGATSGKTHTGKTVQLKEQTLAALDLNHLRADYERDCDYDPSSGTCKMDGFDLSRIGQQRMTRYAYQYVNPQQIAPYWDIASQYVLADHMFQTQGSGSFTAHQDLIAGTTAIDPYDSLIDTPSSSLFWGCDAPPSTVTSLITTNGQYLQWGGPFPCLTYPTGTLRDLLDKAKVSWRYYTPPHYHGTIGALWNAFDAIRAVRYGPEWETNFSIPETNIFNDITYGKLAALSWVVPSQPDSDHPHKLKGVYTGPEWIASVVNAIGESPYWKNTTVIVVWDDWGGFFDHVSPPFFDDAGGLGFRVPMLVVSPYVSDGRVDHTQYEFGSILRYIEQTFNLGSLGTTDERATSIGGMFNYLQPPRTFVPIPSSKNKEYFLHRRPDAEPVDSE